MAYQSTFPEFALTLENLETQFYTQALSKFQSSDFTNAGLISSQIAIEQFQSIQVDESTHATVLTVCAVHNLNFCTNFSYKFAVVRSAVIWRTAHLRLPIRLQLCSH